MRALVLVDWHLPPWLSLLRRDRMALSLSLGMGMAFLNLLLDSLIRLGANNSTQANNFPNIQVKQLFYQHHRDWPHQNHPGRGLFLILPSQCHQAFGLRLRPLPHNPLP
eukprot:m.232486 g.232486  ORF g.232486 m.232486 type:complete len:109 (+) comp18740_c0_seq1:475-801(+)